MTMTTKHVPQHPISVACPTCKAAPNYGCNPHGGSYTREGGVLVHQERSNFARTGVSGVAPAVAQTAQVTLQTAPTGPMGEGHHEIPVQTFVTGQGVPMVGPTPTFTGASGQQIPAPADVPAVPDVEDLVVQLLSAVDYANRLNGEIMYLGQAIHAMLQPAPEQSAAMAANALQTQPAAPAATVNASLTQPAAQSPIAPPSPAPAAEPPKAQGQ